MYIKQLKQMVLLGMCVSLVSAVSAAEVGGVNIAGYFQGSYVANLNKPGTRTNNLHVFDVESNSFNFNAFQLNISKQSDEGVGFVGKLMTGRDARIIKTGGTAGATDFDVQEAYLTYKPKSLNALMFTGGKFVTLEGLEVIESPLNPNISLGYLFNFAEPYTHTGVKANYAFNDSLNATVGVVNGWDVIDNAGAGTIGNDGKTFIWQIATVPVKDKVTFNLSGTVGPENAANSSNRTSIDALLGVTATDKLSLWAQGNWGQDSKNAATPIATSTGGTTPWKGFGFWAKYQYSGMFSQALRFELLDDQNGANRFAQGINQTARNITFTNKFQVTKDVAFRAEYRYDWSSNTAFANSTGFTAGAVGRRDQSTVMADWVYTF